MGEFLGEYEATGLVHVRFKHSPGGGRPYKLSLIFSIIGLIRPCALFYSGMKDLKTRGRVWPAQVNDWGMIHDNGHSLQGPWDPPGPVIHRGP